MIPFLNPHLQSSARCYDHIFGLSDCKESSVNIRKPFSSVIFPFTFPVFISMRHIYCDVRRSPRRSFSPEIACSSNVPDSGMHHARLVFLLAEERPCTTAGCTLSQEPGAFPSPAILWGFQLLLAWELQSSASKPDLAP